jgi:WD40 repeat protein/serine/threonine protein kinase
MNRDTREHKGDMEKYTGQFLGRYQIQEFLSSEERSLSFKATDVHMDRKVVITFLVLEAMTPDDQSELTRVMSQRSKALACLSHPNLTHIQDFGFHEGSPFLVTPYIPGKSLKQAYAKRNGKIKSLPFRQVASLLLPVARAVHYAHQEGVIHGKINPDNIILSADGLPILTSFSLIPTSLTIFADIAAFLEIFHSLVNIKKIDSEMTNSAGSIAALERLLAAGNTEDATQSYKDMEELVSDLQEISGAAKLKVKPSVRRRRVLTTSAILIPALLLIFLVLIFSGALNGYLISLPGASILLAQNPQIIIYTKTATLTTAPSLTPAIYATPTPIFTLTPTRVLSSTVVITSTPTYFSSPTVTATPELPAGEGTAYPYASAPLSAENVTRITPLARWGEGIINQVLYSPNGEFLVVSSSLGLYVYDAATLEKLKLIETGIAVLSAAISPDSSLVITVTVDHMVRVWRLEDGELLHTFDSEANAVSFTWDGKLQILADRTVYLFTAYDWLPYWRVDYTITEDSINDAVVTANGESMVMALSSTNETRSVLLWSHADNSLFSSIDTSVVRQVATSPDGSLVAMLGSFPVELYDTHTWTSKGKLAYGTTLAFSGDGSLLALGGAGGNVSLYTIPGQTLARSMVGHNTQKVTSLAFSPDQRYIASLSTCDGSVIVWDVQTGQQVHNLEGFDGVSFVKGCTSYTSIQWQPILGFAQDGNLLSFLRYNGDYQIGFWRAEDGNFYKDFALDLLLPPQRITYSTEDIGLTVWGLQNTSSFSTSRDDKFLTASISLSSASTTPISFDQVSYSKPSKIIMWLDISNDRSMIAGLSETSDILVYRTEPLTLVATLHNYIPASGAIFSPDASILAGIYENSFFFWSIPEGASLCNLKDFDQISPGGNFIKSHSFTYQDERAIPHADIYDSTNGAWLWSVNESSCELSAFTPDDSLFVCVFRTGEDPLVEGWQDALIQVFEAQNGQLLQTIELQDTIEAMAISPEGGRIAIVSSNQTISIWGIIP